MFMIIGIVFTPFQEMIENKTIRKARSHPMAKRAIIWICCAIFMAAATGCGTTYKAQPLPFKTPDAYGNTADVNGAKIGGRAFVDPQQAREAFGFDIRAAGMLPVQVVFDNQGSVPLVINPGQTFLVDNEGNLWPILTDRFAYERATKYAQTQNIFKEGAYNSFLGAAAGAIVGAAVGIVSNKDPLRSAGEGAAVGAAAGAVGGGLKGYSEDARATIVGDLRDKSLENKAIEPGDLAHGIIFFPGEAKSARQLRLQLKETNSDRTHTVNLAF